MQGSATWGREGRCQACVGLWVLAAAAHPPPPHTVHGQPWLCGRHELHGGGKCGLASCRQGECVTLPCCLTRKLETTRMYFPSFRGPGVWHDLPGPLLRASPGRGPSVRLGPCLIWGSGPLPADVTVGDFISSKRWDSGSAGKPLLLDVSELRKCPSPCRGLF